MKQRHTLLARLFKRQRSTAEERLLEQTSRAVASTLVSLQQINKAGGRTYRP